MEEAGELICIALKSCFMGTVLIGLSLFGSSLPQRRSCKILSDSGRRKPLVRTNLEHFNSFQFHYLLRHHCRLRHRYLATFRLEYEDDYEYKFSVLSTRFRFGGRKFSKCECSEFKTRTRIVVLVLQSEGRYY